MKRFVILGDVKTSRKIKERVSFQEKLERACNEVNEKYPDDIEANFEIYKGLDEVGGVLKNLSNCYRILLIFNNYLFPEKIRFSIVFGEVNQSEDVKDVRRMDGSAFLVATYNIIELKKTRRLVRFQINNKMTDSLIEGEINLLLWRRNSWTSHTRTVIDDMIILKSEKEVAKNYKVTSQAISDILTRVKWKDMVKIENDLNAALSEYTMQLING
jgi:hypothetical protein